MSLNHAYSGLHYKFEQIKTKVKDYSFLKQLMLCQSWCAVVQICECSTAVQCCRFWPAFSFTKVFFFVQFTRLNNHYPKMLPSIFLSEYIGLYVLSILSNL